MKVERQNKIRPGRVFGLLLLVCGLIGLLTVQAAALTLEVIDAETGAQVNGYRWLVEEDNTNQKPPQVPSNSSIAVDIHMSHAPVVLAGEQDLGSVDILVPANGGPTDKPYFISVLPYHDYQLGGIRVETGSTSARVYVNKHPIPTAQLSVFVFEDNFPINNAPDQPNELGLAGWSVEISDYAGPVLTDAFGNLLGTTYQKNPDGSAVLAADGSPIVVSYGDGLITTDADGYALIKNLAPNKYGVVITPPGAEVGQWYQTATIEGGPAIDAWVQANEPPIFVEGFGTGFTHVAFGFVNPARLPGIPDPGTGAAQVTVSGQNVYNHFSRPPFLQGFFAGEPVDECLIGINDAVTNEGLTMVECNPDSTFSVSGLYEGEAYQLVTWDRPLISLFGTNALTVPVGQGDTDLGDVLSFRWFGTLDGQIFQDNNANGIWDAGDTPLPEQAVNIRFRDGSLYKTTVTTPDGNYSFAEVFPFFKWLVVESDFARFRTSGMTAYVDYGGTLDPEHDYVADPTLATEPLPWPERVAFEDPNAQTANYHLHPQPQDPNDPANAYGAKYSRTELGDLLLTQGMLLFLNQHITIDWGRIPYTTGQNGGISGIVYYTTVRAEDNPADAGAEDWEPGIPRVQVALYEDFNQDGEIDDVTGDGQALLADVDNWPFGWISGGAKGVEDIDRNGNGSFDYGDAINLVATDSWDDNQPTGCIQKVPIIAGQPTRDCFDNFGTWNQVRPEVFDGGYAFSGYIPGGMVSGRPEVPFIPTGTYIVEAATPPYYVIQKEEDKNVDFGDALVPSPLALVPPPPCVGDLHEVPPYLSMLTRESDPFALLPGVDPQLAVDTEPFYSGQMRHLCDRRQVFVNETANTATDFFMFTRVPKASRVVGFVNNDLAAEFDPTSPVFGEKSAPAWLPVSFQDWKGNEVARVYTDEYGAYNSMLPSTWTTNVPAPSGMSANMITAVLNHQGPIRDNNPASSTYGQLVIDPNYDPGFSTTPWTLDYLPAKTTYLDTPLVAVAAFAGVPALDVSLPDATPVISSVTGPDNVAAICNDGSAILTITSAGLQLVDNPNYDANDPNSNAQVLRDYGFGDLEGTVAIGGVVIPPLPTTYVPTAISSPVTGGSGYTTATGVATTPTIAGGSGLTVDITAAAGVVTAVAINTPGTGYTLGDTITVTGGDGGATFTITAGNLTAPTGVISWSTNEITLVVPGSVSSGPVVVTRSDTGRSSQGVNVLVNCALSPATTLYVDAGYNDSVTPSDGTLAAPYNTIQAAIDAAGDGDDIMIAPGIYDENVIMWKPVQLHGAGAGNTLITATPTIAARLQNWHARIASLMNITDTNPFVPKEAPGIMVIGQDLATYPGMTAHDFTGQPALIEGLGIRSALSGGGIYVNNNAYNLEIRYNALDNNQGQYGGGIILGEPQLDNQNTGVFIHDNSLVKNAGVQGPGAIAIYAGSHNYRVVDNLITGNFSRFAGGGIGHISTSDNGLIQGNRILFNEVFYGLIEGGRGGGGGIFLAGTDTVANNTIVPPPANTPGAGSVTIADNLIQGNLAGAQDGGGILAWAFNGSTGAALDYTLTIVNNIIVNNVTALAGGGIALQDAAHVAIIHNTIARNDSAAAAALAFPAGGTGISTPQPAGIVSHGYSIELATATGESFSDPLLTGNILWQNRSYYNDDSLNGSIGGLRPASTHPDAATAGYADVMDLGVIGTGVPTDAMNPVRGILTDASGYDPSNLESDPVFALEYANSLKSAAIADEGGNFISLRFTPLTQGAGDYHLGSPCSPAVLFAPAADGNSPASDIDGETRDANPDIGADEFSGGSGVTNALVLTLLTPNGGELIPAGSDFVINWEATDPSHTFDLAYRLGPGQPWVQIASGVSATCQLWNVPGTVREADNAQLAVVDSSGAADVSDGVFTIDSLALISPNGGESVVAGNTLSILWTNAYSPSATTAGVWYQLGTDFSGRTFLGSTTASSGRLDWLLPDQRAAVDDVRIILGLFDGNGQLVLTDQSRSGFTIFPNTAAAAVAPATAGLATLSAGAAPAATLTRQKTAGLSVLSPNGGEILKLGDEVPVLWSTSSAVTAAQVEVAIKTGAGAWQSLVKLDGDPGYYLWTVAGEPGDPVVLKVERFDADGNSIDADLTDEPFTIVPAE